MTKRVNRSLIHFVLEGRSIVRRRTPMQRFLSSNQFKEMDSSLKSKTPAVSSSSSSSSPSSSSDDASTGEIPFSKQGPPKNSQKTKILIAGGVAFLAMIAFGVTVVLPSYALEPAKDSVRRKEELLKERDSGSRGSMWKNLEKRGDRK